MDQQRIDWLSQERENLMTDYDDVKGKFELEVVQRESLTRRISSLERETQEQRAFFSSELNKKSDEGLIMSRQLDGITNDLKKMTDRAILLEARKAELETLVVEKQKQMDQALMDKKLAEQRAADVAKENEMLFQSEERVKRLLNEGNELRAELRQKEREIA